MRAKQRGIIRPYHSGLSLLHRLSDGLCVVGSLWLTFALFELPWHNDYGLPIGCALALFFICAENNDLYRSWRDGSMKQEARRICMSWLGVICGVLLIAYVFKISGQYARRVAMTWFFLTPVLICGWHGLVRLLLRLLRQHGFNSRSVAIAGAGELGAFLAEFIQRNHWLGMKLVGFYDDFKPAGYQPTEESGSAVAGDLDQLAIEARNGAVDFIYIALPMRAQDRIQELLSRLTDSTASVYLVPDLFVFDLLHSHSVNLGGIYSISVFESPFNGISGWVKRIEDIVLGTLLLILFSIPIALIAIGVKLTSPGPILFKQRRYGINGEEIEVWKFRTMRVAEDGPTISQATKGDPRVTPFGAFLRRTSLDELPQFVNVLQGRMSIVGPRPHAVAHNEYYRSMIHGYMLRHKVKPGITGWAQINGWRGETDTLHKMEKRIEHDLWYIRNWSLGLDLKIAFLSVFKGFRSENAY